MQITARITLEEVKKMIQSELETRGYHIELDQIKVTYTRTPDWEMECDGFEVELD